MDESMRPELMDERADNLDPPHRCTRTLNKPPFCEFEVCGLCTVYGCAYKNHWTSDARYVEALQVWIEELSDRIEKLEQEVGELKNGNSI